MKSASGICQQIIPNLTNSLEGIIAYLDDVIVMGRSETEHIRNLEAVLRRIVDFGFQIRTEKCNFMQTRVKYLGYVLDKNGRRPDPAKIAASQRMPIPKDFQSLRSFVGTVKYYENFVKEMRSIAHHWTPSQEGCKMVLERSFSASSRRHQTNTLIKSSLNALRLYSENRSGRRRLKLWNRSSHTSSISRWHGESDSACPSPPQGNRGGIRSD